MDERSENSYSVLPILSKIGVLNSEGPGLFRSQPLPSPIFAFGMPNTGLTSLAMALSMLGYRCCSDLNILPNIEEENLLNKDGSNIFNAYVNIGSIEPYLDKIAVLYPDAKLILIQQSLTDSFHIQKWSGRTLVLPSTSDKWKPLCEFLSNVPPVTPYPVCLELGQRQLNLTEKKPIQAPIVGEHWLKSDTSPWIIKPGIQWKGIALNEDKNYSQALTGNHVTIIDHFDHLDESIWHLREDTFQGNLSLFSPSNFLTNDSGHAEITIRCEDMGVRQYSSGALTTCSRFLFGRFEAVLKPPKVAGLVTGIFLHRDSPRQEIDIEFLGNSPTKILVNVYYNPGDEGVRFDYGYRGTPVLIDLGFDSTTDFHTYTIEWGANEIRWFVDNKLIHTRVNWASTPIPHLPMKFHVNLWPSQSHELAGKLSNRFLPSSTLLQSVRITTSNSS